MTIRWNSQRATGALSRRTLLPSLALAASGLFALAGCAGADASDGEPTLADGEAGGENVAASEATITRAPLSTAPPWTVMISGYAPDSMCSATILSERWLLTAAHCLTKLPNATTPISLTVSRAAPLGTSLPIYNGRGWVIEHPSFVDEDTTPEADASLVYLESYGIDLSSMGRAKLFADERRPWRDPSLAPDFSVAGWGDGSDPSGSSSCAGLTGGKLRLGSGFKMDWSTEGGYMSARLGPTRTCPGDSGGAWLLSRGSAQSPEWMQFGVTSSTNSTWQFAPVIEDLFSFIEETLRYDTPSHFGSYLVPRTVSTWKYRTVDMVSRGWASVTGLAQKCLSAAGTTAGSAAQLRACGTTPDVKQTWNFYVNGELRNGTIGAPQASLCLETAGGSMAVGTALRIATCTGNLAQRFVLTPAGYLRPATAPDKCVQPKGGSSVEGTPLVLATCNQSTAQVWTR